MEAFSVFVPSCETGGSFTSKQCQQGGQCWCVDPTGRELPGTRQHGHSLVCSEYPGTACRQRDSRLLSSQSHIISSLLFKSLPFSSCLVYAHHASSLFISSCRLFIFLSSLISCILISYCNISYLIFSFLFSSSSLFSFCPTCYVPRPLLLLLLLQVQVMLTVILSVVWLCPGSSLVLSILLRPPLVDLRPPVSPSSGLLGNSCQWRGIRPPTCLTWSKSSRVSSPRWAELCRLWPAPPPVASRRTCSEGSS